MLNNRFCRNTLIILIFLAWSALVWPLWASPLNHADRLPDSLVPQQITAETDPILHMAVSPDGQWVVYALSTDGFTDLWLRSAKPIQTILPRQLTFDPSDEASPTFSPDGELLAFTGTTYDVKGDLFLLKLHDPQAQPVRLTGRQTEDGGPCFSKDGRWLYFHQANPGETLKHLAVIDLNDPSHPVHTLVTGRDGSFPKVSPDGNKIAFISHKDDPLGDIYLYDCRQKRLQCLTQGPYMDFLPTWSPDGRNLLFSRIAVDTDRDSQLSTKDHAVIFKIKVGAADEPADAFAYPLTRLNYSSFQPQAVEGDLYFLSDRGGVSNCWKLPLSGVIPPQTDAAQQMALARRLAEATPYDPFETALAYYKVMERFPRQTPISAQAAYEIGEIWWQLGFEEAARAGFDAVSERYGDISPYNALAKIQQVMVGANLKLQREPATQLRQTIIQNALSALATIGDTASDEAQIHARSCLERARLMLLYQPTPKNLLASLELLEQALSPPPEDAVAAEALILKAEIYQKIGRTQDLHAIYLNVIKNFAAQSFWSDKAVERLITLNLDGLGDVTTETKIKYLRTLFDKNRTDNPQLAIGALNRIGDLYFKTDHWPEAKAAYYQVLHQFSQLTPQTTAARLALAEILYKEERFRQALDLYETEIAQRPPNDRVYYLARNGYIQKSIASGEFLFQLGEVLAARKTFKALLDYDDTVVEAHRGYMKCEAALQEIGSILKSYRERLARDPNNPVLIYSVALALTYLNQESALLEAEDLLLSAIAIDGRPEYYHQTLGYVYEVLETVYHHRNSMPLALEAYKKAYFLNDHENNRLNAANLQLNLGNSYFYLKQYGKAFTYYEKRLTSRVPFDNPNTEIVFYQRLGMAAFQSREKETTIAAFIKVLAIIDNRLDPRQTTVAFDDLHRFAMDHLLIPGLKYVAETAKPLATKQSEIHNRLSQLSEYLFPPPEPKWYQYKRGIKRLLDQQKALFPVLIDLHRDLAALGKQSPGLEVEDVQRSLKHLALKVEQTLAFPERLTELKTEILDRLGLAYQEAGQWRLAAETFQKTFELNQRRQLTANLAKNKRQVAYTHYRYANDLTGQERRRYLELAAEEFKAALKLVKTYGVAQAKAAPSESLFSFNVQVALDEFQRSQAVRGFSVQQEQRLDEAFLTRIAVERGDLATAGEYLTRQLENYPLGRKVAEPDTFGVSLLYHQAGLLAYANGRLPEALQYFRYSAELCVNMQTPVSLALNVRNMAQILRDPHFPAANLDQNCAQLERLSRLAGNQLAGSPMVAGKPVAAIFQNAMGVYALSELNLPAKGVRSAVDNMRVLQRAAGHFQKGLSYYTDPQGRLLDPKDRYSVNMMATLDLNLAHTAELLGESQRAQSYFKQARDLAVSAFFPDIAWRAEVGLGQLEAALDALEQVTVLRAGCQKDEIIQAFGSQVKALVEKGAAEAAFNLAERLSEFERYNRLAFMVNPLNGADMRLLATVYTHFLKITELKQKAREKGADKQFLQERIAQEQAFIKTQLGPSRERLPGFVRAVTEKDLQEQLIIALGVAIEAENTADSITAAKSGTPQYQQLVARHRDLIKTYQTIRKQALRNRSLERGADILTFLGPEPVEAIDVMESLPENGLMLRLFDVGEQHVLFTLTPSEIRASLINGDLTEWPYPAEAQSRVVYLAYEAPQALHGHAADARVFSGTHFVRCILNRKPFKRNVLTDMPNLLADAAFADYTVTPLKRFTGAEVDRHLQGVNTIWLAGKTTPSVTIPTRAGDNAFPMLAFQSLQGHQLPLDQLFSDAPNVSLTLLSGASATDAYVCGQVLAILGCPSVMVPRQSPANSTFITDFLKQYQTRSVKDALETTSRAYPQAAWLLLGDQGLTPDAASALARKHFLNYVKKGRQAFQQNEPDTALALFENAVTIADHNQKTYGRYLGPLYQFARQSAYKSDNLEKAEQYAEKLKQLVERRQPDSKAHAEALLSLGLIQAKGENFKKAVPHLEKAVQMFANLELDDEWISALTNFGIVLENATEYDRALGQFASAAEVSRDMGQKAILARQYVNIGRINDLRLSRYALAIQSYQKALALYRELGQAPHIAQALLDTGRCYRLIGNFLKADHLYQEALATIHNEPPSTAKNDMIGKIIIEQANNAWFQGRYEAAFQLQRKAFKMAQDNDLPLLQEISLNTSGLIWWTLGNQQKAMLELTQALKEARALESREDEVASTLNNIGLVERENGRYEAALKAFDQALAIDTRLKSRWAMAYDYRNQALTYLKQGVPDKALPLFNEAYNLAHSIGNRINEAKALLGLGDAYSATGQTDQAREAYQKARQLSERMLIRETQWRAIFGLAKIELAADPAAAVQLLYQSIAVIEQIRSDIKIAQLKDSYVVNKLSVYETLIALLADQGKIIEAFEISERSRGRNFIDLLGNQQLSLNRAVDQAHYDHQLRLKAQIREYEALMVQAATAAERDLYQKKLQNLKNELDNVMLEIQAANPQLSAIVSVEPLNAEKLLAYLEPQVALISYYVMPHELFCWVLRAPGSTEAPISIQLIRTPLDRATLGKRILQYRRLIQNLEPLDVQSHELYNWLIAPVEPYLKGVHQLGIIPYGQLHYLSFATLADQNHYLLDQYSLFYLPSASVLKYTINKRKTIKQYRVLAIGNPDLGDPSLALPFAEHEVNSIKWNFPDITILTHEKATEKWVADNIDQYGIIHIASHGEFDPINPLFSAIKLSHAVDTEPPQDAGETSKRMGEADGNLEAGEVFGLNINADVVVLSACQTGLGKVEQGDDVIGLNRAFFYAGTHTIISSLWRVSDVATAILLKQFYREYLRNNKADSLRLAALHVKQRYVHPGYWGAFTLVGDYY